MLKRQKNSRLTPQKPKKVIRAFRHAGFIVRGETGGLPKSRTAGSHEIMDNPSTGRMVVVTHKKNHDVSTDMRRMLIRRAGMTVEEFLECLDRKQAPPDPPEDTLIIRTLRIL